MGITEWAKRAAIILPVALSGCEYFTPQGIPVKQDADGIVSAKEEEEIKTAIEKPGFVNDASPYLPFANDFNAYAADNFRQQGLPSYRFSDDMHIAFVDNTLDYCITKNPWVSPACSDNSNSTLFFKKYLFQPLHFFRTLFHEAGHQLRQDAYEFPSEANRAYFLLNVYGFNKRVGSALVGSAFNLPVPLVDSNNIAQQWCLPVNEYLEGNFKHYYGFGDMEFLALANRFNGNLEMALDKIMRAPRLWLEQDVKNVLAGYSNTCDAMHGEFEKLLGNPGFIERLEKSMSVEERLELTGYLQFIANHETGFALSDDRLVPQPEWLARTISEGEGFASRFGNNDYFRQVVMDKVSSAYITKARDMLNSGQSYSGGLLWEIHRIAKKVIGMNRDYPCTFNIDTCPLELSVPRAYHAAAYLYALYFRAEMINAGIETHASLIALPEDYAQRFYASGNYHYEDNEVGVAVHTPEISFIAGDIEEDMAEIATSYFDLEGMRQHICRAVDWYKAAVEAGCSRIPDEEIKARCSNAVDARFESVAAARIEGKREYYEENCR